MASVVGWYGPLIDLTKANEFVGDFVQLLVWVHNFSRRDILVGDDTRPYFPVSVGPHRLGSSFPVSGDLVLLQNVRITKFGNLLEAKTVHCSSLLPLIHPHYSLLFKEVDELVAGCRVGVAAKEKLRRVIQWVKQSRPGFRRPQLDCHRVARNWKLPEETKSKDCLYLSEVLHLTDSCKAAFHGSVGEIVHPLFDNEKIFLSARLYETGDSPLATDLICTGCLLCGSPLNLDHRSMFERNESPLYCSESSNRLHVVNFIYKPFTLYVWDESECVPILVRNKAAEILFGNIKAEQVYSSFRAQMKDASGVSGNPDSCSLEGVKEMDFYVIWIILLKALLRQGKNSPLKFEVNVNTSLERENGRFQMVSVRMPCFRTKVSLTSKKRTNDSKLS